MKKDVPICWCCVWRSITGSGNDPTIGCGHPSKPVRKRFRGSSTAAGCPEYLEDDPLLKVEVDRESRVSLMNALHQMVIGCGQYKRAEAIMDYFSPNRRDIPQEITCDDFTFLAYVEFGGSEGLFLECCLVGRIQDGGQEGRWSLGTYKTLDTSLTSAQILGELAGALTYCARRYFWENSRRFLTMRELRAKTIREKAKERGVRK